MQPYASKTWCVSPENTKHAQLNPAQRYPYARLFVRDTASCAWSLLPYLSTEVNNSNDHNYKLFFVKGFYAATTSLVGCLVPRVVVVTSVAACLRECEGNSICQPVKETLGHGPQQHGSHWMLLVAVQFIPLGSVLFLYLRNQMLQSRVELLATFISFFYFFFVDFLLCWGGRRWRGTAA